MITINICTHKDGCDLWKYRFEEKDTSILPDIYPNADPDFIVKQLQEFLEDGYQPIATGERFLEAIRKWIEEGKTLKVEVL